MTSGSVREMMYFSSGLTVVASAAQALMALAKGSRGSKQMAIFCVRTQDRCLSHTGKGSLAVEQDPVTRTG